MVDEALERSRRHAWARYFAARRDAQRMQLWAIELAEWLEACSDELPPQALALAEMVRTGAEPRDLEAVRRYVASCATLTA